MLVFEVNTVEKVRADAGASLQLTVPLLCGVVAMLDGFDTQAVGFIAPAAAKEWGLKAASFGPAFAAGFLGLLLGAFIFGALADRIGRRKVILITTAIFGMASLAATAADSLLVLAMLRFVTGLGLGGAMPNLVALTSEYAPPNRRAMLVIAMFCGFPLGAVFGALASSWLIGAFGWRSIFALGGITPLLFLFILWAKLPESAHFLDGRKTQHGSRSAQSRGLQALFAEGRAPTSAALWTISFLNLLIMYSLLSWIPTLLNQSGVQLSAAILGAALLNAGGVIGGIAVAAWLDRTRQDPSAVVVLFACAAGGILMLALIEPSAGPTTAALFLSGVGVIGGQLAITSISATFYPVEMRSTGVGAVLGVGRIGAIIGPFAGGEALLRGASPQLFFLSLVSAAVLCALAGICLARCSKEQAHA